VKTKIYLVNKLKQNIEVHDNWGNSHTLPCSDLADGCIGVSLWFKDKETAMEYGECQESDLEVAEVDFDEKKGKK